MGAAVPPFDSPGLTSFPCEVCPSHGGRLARLDLSPGLRSVCGDDGRDPGAGISWLHKRNAAPAQLALALGPGRAPGPRAPALGTGPRKPGFCKELWTRQV